MMEGPSPSAVFIDTSLGTHLAMLVSGADTVSDLKSNSGFLFFFRICVCIFTFVCFGVCPVLPMFDGVVVPGLILE